MSQPASSQPASSQQRLAVAVTGWSLHLPGFDLAAVAPELAADGPGAACPPERAQEMLGRKGLLNKDPATRLALCAVHRALRLEPGAGRAAGPPDPSVAVVVSSNLGNVATVVEVVQAIRAGRRKDISPLSAPGASSNVIASAVAIWFGFGGPNLLVCSGATAGVDAITAGALLLRAGRAKTVIVVGAEPADEVAAALRGGSASGAAPLRAGAACVVLEPAAAAPGAPALTAVADPDAPPPSGISLFVGPARRAGQAARVISLDLSCGDLYGAAGVAQAAIAARIAAGPAPAAARVVAGDDIDGWRALDIWPPEHAVSASRSRGNS